VISRRALLAAGPLAVACARRPGTGFRGTAFVATEESNSVVAVDLLAFAVRNRIELPASPTALSRHPDPAQHQLFALTPRGHALEVIDTQARARVRSIRLPGQPMAAQWSQGKLWCLLKDAPRLHALEGKGIPLPASPVAFDLSREAPIACITLENGQVVFADLESRRLLPPLDLEGELGQPCFRRDGKVVLVAERRQHRLTVIDTSSRAIMTQLPLALSPDHLCVSADGGQVFITGQGRDAVVIAYAYRTEIAQTSLSGRKPGCMAVSADPNFLFVANPEAGSVSVFDITTQKVVAVTGVGMDPGAIVVTPDQEYALVLNRASADMAVIRISAITVGRAKSAPLFTMIPVGSRPVDAVVVPA